MRPLGVLATTMSTLACVTLVNFCASVIPAGQTGLGRTPSAEEIRAWETETMRAVAARDETLRGRLIDKRCYLDDKSNLGLAHKGMSRTCAVECAKKGENLALLTSDGKLYEIGGGLAAENNAKLASHLGHIVEIIGTTMNHGRDRLMIDGVTLTMISR